MNRRRTHPLPHLVGAMTLSGPHGMCFHRAAAFVIDTPGSTLCIGTFDPDPGSEYWRDDDSLVPLIHCWPEWRGKAYAVATIERNGGLHAADASVYRAINRASDIKRLTRQQVLKIARAINLSGYLLRDEPLKAGASVGGSLLAAAGVPYRITDDGAVLPPKNHGSQDHD